MPMNAPPEFYKAMDMYSSARTISEKIKYLQEALRHLPKHKGTENMRAQLNRKLAELRKMARKKRKSSGVSLLIPKQGFQVAVWGDADLTGEAIRRYTGKEVKDLSRPQPFDMNGVQLVHLPPYFEGIEETRFASLIFPSIRAADRVMLLSREDLLPVLEEQGIYVNREPPPVRVERSYSGGINIVGESLLEGEKEEVVTILQEHGIYNATVVFLGRATPWDVELVLDEGVAFKKGYIGESIPPREDLPKLLKYIRVYTRPPRGEISRKPVVMEEGSTVEELAEEIGIPFRRAVVERDGKKRIVPKDFVLQDGDIVEFR